MLVNFVEMCFSMSLLANALVFLPQATTIYKQKNANGTSLLTFLGFNVIQFFTICHGYIVGDDKLMYGFILSFFMCGIVNVLIIYYTLKNKLTH